MSDTSRKTPQQAPIYGQLSSTLSATRDFVMKRSKKNLISQRSDSQASDELSFQLSTHPNFTVLYPRNPLIPGPSSALSLVSKRLNFSQCLPSDANNTTILNPDLSNAVHTSMPELCV